jgi:hypothetical protein
MNQFRSVDINTLVVRRFKVRVKKRNSILRIIYTFIEYKYNNNNAKVNVNYCFRI